MDWKAAVTHQWAILEGPGVGNHTDAREAQLIPAEGGHRTGARGAGPCHFVGVGLVRHGLNFLHTSHSALPELSSLVISSAQ